MNPQEVELGLSRDEAARTLAQAAEDWGGEWEAGGDGGTLTLPVVYGLRHGMMRGRVKLVPSGIDRTRVVWTHEESRLEVHRSAVMVLSIAAVPLLASLAWPFYLPLFALVPFAAVTGLLAWWLVVSRLRASGPAEFLADLAAPEASAEAAVESSDAPVR